MGDSINEDGFVPENLTQAQRWGLALTGILAEATELHHESLYGMEPTDENIRVWRGVLCRDWDIQTRDDLHQTFDEFPANNPAFSGIRDHLESMSVSARRAFISSQKEKDQLTYARVMIVNLSLGRWSPAGITAWDQGRLIMLCRWGALTGLHTAEEAWEHIMEAARIIQLAYKNWYDYGQHYIAGRQFWLGSLSVDHANLQLSRMKKVIMKGVWGDIPWDLDLEQL